jgi:recombinase
MAKIERVRQDVSASFGPDDLRRQSEQGWKMVAVEWEHELPDEAAEPGVPGQVPFGLQVAPDPPPRLEENTTEREILFLMMELTIQDGPYSAIADELNRRGYRTRQGMKWTPVSVFQMLPRLIEVGPTIFATEEWQQRRQKLAKLVAR